MENPAEGGNGGKPKVFGASKLSTSGKVSMADELSPAGYGSPKGSGEYTLHGGLSGGLQEQPAVVDAAKDPHTKILYTFGKVVVWLVKGELVRLYSDMDFTMGGNPEQYKYIPRSPNYEIWIDDKSGISEYDYDIFHEMYEAIQMLKGDSYEVAHPKANKLEYQWRVDGSVPAHLLEELAQEIQDRAYGKE
jgi:hypothetical protein